MIKFSLTNFHFPYFSRLLTYSSFAANNLTEKIVLWIYATSRTDNKDCVNCSDSEYLSRVRERFSLHPFFPSSSYLPPADANYSMKEKVSLGGEKRKIEFNFFIFIILCEKRDESSSFNNIQRWQKNLPFKHEKLRATSTWQLKK